MAQPLKKINPIRWVPSVYFGMGLPFVMLSAVAVIMFTRLGISDAKAAFWTSLIVLPWTLKPLWSPFLEIFKTKKHFVVITQLITGVAFALVAFSLQLPDFFAWALGLMAVIAFSGATHDIATDGVYMDELSTSQQAAYIGWQGAFFNIAKVVCNGGLIFLAGKLKDIIGIVNTWMAIMFICAAIMILLSIYHKFVLPSGKVSETKINNAKEAWSSFGEVFKTFFRKKFIWIYVSFIILYRLAEGLAIKISPLFLLADTAKGGLGMTEDQYGIIVGTIGTLAFILGSILAGHYIAKKGLRKTLFFLCCAINLPFLVYLALAIYQPSNIALIGSAIVAEYFGYGFGFVGLTLFMMQQVAPGKHKMAHYAFASGVMNLGFMLAGMVSGFLSDWLGYEGFFIVVALAMIPAIVLSRIVPFSHKDKDNEPVSGEMPAQEIAK